MSLVARLIGLVAETVGAADSAEEGESEERLAAAALLVHVARVDGRWTPVERERMADLVRSRLGLSPQGTERLLDRADTLDREADDISTLIGMMGHGLDLEARRRLLAMAYAVAAADGQIHEFEADLIWRVGRLLGFDEAQIQEIRHTATAEFRSPA